MSRLMIVTTNHRAPWTDQDDERLRELAEQGELIGGAAAILGRTRLAVANRALLLGVALRSSPGRGRKVLHLVGPR